MTALPEILRGRAGAFAALGVAVLAFMLVIVAPIAAAFSAQSDDIAESLRQLGVYRAENESRPALEAELAALDRQGASVPGVIEGESAALAQAQLQSEIKALVEASAGAVRSLQAIPVTKQNGFETIAVQCDFSVPQSKLRELAYAVAAHKPYLFVDEASITAPPSDLDNVQTHQATLDVRWTVHGYRWVAQK